MSLVKWAFVGILILPVAEVAAFVLVAMAIGWLWAVALFLATSLLGLMVLRHSGRADFDRLRTGLGPDGVGVELRGSSLGTMAGGILLVLPGFITDLLGLLMLVAPLRRLAGATVGRALLKPRKRRRRDPSVVDLAPEEWHQVSDGLEDQRRRRRRNPKRTVS